MDVKALFNISYGVFLLATKSNGKTNACITNTCMQVAGNPTRIAISCINTNYTTELLKESKVFALSILDNTATFETIKHFGLQSGRNVDKFADIALPEDLNGMPYLGWQACSVLSCHVVDSMDLGSHTMFIAEIDDAKVLSENPPVTYTDYQTRLKPKAPKPAEEKKIVAWRCKICGYRYEGAELPKEFLCPLCGHDASDFEPIYE